MIERVNLDNPFDPGGGGFFVPPEGRRKPPPVQQTPPLGQLDVPKFEQSKSKEAFDEASKLRNDYSADQRVKDFLAVTPGYVSALETAPNTSGDLSLIYAFAKMMDPISAVREGEQAAVASSDTLYGQTVARLKKEMGEGGTFRPEIRQSLRSEMRRRYDNILTGYQQAREHYGKIATDVYHLPPEAVIGDPAGAPYAGKIREYAGKLRGGETGQQGLAPGESISNAIEMDKPAPAMTPEQITKYEAWTKVNPRPTAQQLMDFFSTELQVGLDPARAAAIEAATAKGARQAPGEAIKTAEQLAEEEAAEAQKAADKVRADELHLQRDEASGRMLDATGGWFGGSAAEGDKARLLKHGITLGLTDEASGLGHALANPLTPFESYRAGRDEEQMRVEEARARAGWGGTVAEIGGNVMSLNPTAIAANLSRTAAAAQAAKQGGATSALAGFGEGRGARESLGNAAIYGATGAAIAPAIPAVVEGLGTAARAGRRALARGAGDIDLAAAARAENVPISRPMFDPATRTQMADLESSAGSSGVVREGLEGTRAGIEAGARRIQGQGTVLETPDAGTIVQSAGQRFIDRSRATANRLYDRARQLAGPDATVTPRAGLTALRRELTDLRGAKNVNKGEIDFINEIGADLTEGPLTVEAIRAIRQGVRGRINEKNLTATQAEARAHRILDALQRDVTDSLPSAAGTAFRRADTYYRERMTHIDDVIEGFIGRTGSGQPKLSGEQAFNKLKSMANPKTGDARRMAAMWRNMEPGEQDDMVATIMQAIGRKDADSPFTVDRFLTQIGNISPSARRGMFGPRGAESIDNLVRLSNALKAAQSEMNLTKSGKVVKMGWGKPLAALLLGGTGGSLVSGATGTAMIAGGALAAAYANAGIRNLSARTLMNPRVSLWLADLGQANTEIQASEMVRRLGVIMAREPALRDELEPLKQQLAGVIGVKQDDTKLKAEDTR